MTTVGNSWTVTTATSSTQENVKEESTYLGKKATRVDSVHKSSAGATSYSTYLAVSAAKNQQLGSVTTQPAYYETYTDPAIDIYKDMAPGETRTQSYTGFNMTSPSIVSSTTTFSNRITYVGRETITVPAGTFETCKEVAEITSMGRTVTVTHWRIASGKYAGLHAKLNDEETTKLSVSW